LSRGVSRLLLHGIQKPGFPDATGLPRGVLTFGAI
jgi:hypothetical protein